MAAIDPTIRTTLECSLDVLTDMIVKSNNENYNDAEELRRKLLQKLDKIVSSVQVIEFETTCPECMLPVSFDELTTFSGICESCTWDND